MTLLKQAQLKPDSGLSLVFFKLNLSLIQGQNKTRFRLYLRLDQVQLRLNLGKLNFGLIEVYLKADLG